MANGRSMTEKGSSYVKYDGSTMIDSYLMALMVND